MHGETVKSNNWGLAPTSVGSFFLPIVTCIFSSTDHKTIPAQLQWIYDRQSFCACTCNVQFLNHPDTHEKGASSEVWAEPFAVTHNCVVDKTGTKELVS